MSGNLIPILWFSAKTYYEENGKNADQWTWQEPYIHEKSIEEILDYLKENPPAIFGFSVFVWSYLEADELAKQIKELYPDCLIIYGGPQIDIKYSNNFFQQKPWVDLVVPSDVYGEPVITYILDNFNDLKHSEIPEVYYHRAGIKFRSKHELKKRDFVWPKNIFAKQRSYIRSGNNSAVIYETTRGCPYRCIYCDWGGGTFTKVTKKPIETIYGELETLANAGVEFLFIADANFGSFKQDVDIIEYVAHLKNTYGFPKSVNHENAKNNLDRVIQIQKILIQNRLSPYYKISIQSPDETVKENIDRVDIAFDKYVAAINELKKEFNAPIIMETILGLPGDNYKLTLDTINLVYDHAFDSFRSSIWQLLPEAPAYDPEVRKKFKIKTKWFEVHTQPFRYKKHIVPDENVRTMRDTSMSSENVISTYSFSEEEWSDMVTVTTLASIGKTIGVGMLIRYLKDHHNITAGEFFDIVYKEIIKQAKFNDKELNCKFLEIPKKLHEVATKDSINKLEFDVSDDFPLILSIYLYTTFLILMHPKSFYTGIGNYFASKLNDPKVADLGNYLTNIMIDINYDPLIKRTFLTEYNWYGYFDLNNSLTKGQYEYKILDEKLKLVSSIDFDYSDYPEQTDINQKIKQFFYHRVSNQARKKYAQHIVESKL